MRAFQDIKSQLEAAEKELKELDDKLGRAGPLPPRRDAPRDSVVGKRRISDREDRGNRWEGPPAKRFLDDGPRGRGRPENDFGREGRDPWGSTRRREVGNGGGRDVEDRLGGRVPGGRAERRESQRGEAEREEGEFDDQSSEKPSGSSTASGPARRVSAGARGGVDTARHKRMFGALLGTLKTFQKDIQKDTQVEEKRKSIQQKIAERVQKENEDAAAQRKRLIEEKKAKLDQLKKLKDELAMAKNHKQFVQHNRGLANFIQTKAEPFIFYLPAKLNDQTRALLEETRKKIHEKYPEVESGDDLGKESDHEDNDVGDLPKQEGGDDAAAAGDERNEKREGKEEDGDKSDSEIRVVLKTSSLDEEQENEGHGTVKFKTDGLDSEEDKGGEDDVAELHED